MGRIFGGWRMSWLRLFISRSDYNLLRLLILPFQLIAELFGIEIGREKGEKTEKPPLKVRILSLPDNLVMAAKSSWRSRERVLAVFAGVFLASLVISTVWLMESDYHKHSFSTHCKRKFSMLRLTLLTTQELTLKDALTTPYFGNLCVMSSWRWKNSQIAA